MSQPPSISELAAQVSKDSAKVEDYLRSNNLPQPSFLPDGPTSIAIDAKDVEDARIAAIGGARELLDLLLGPVSCLRLSTHAGSLEAIYRWDIPRHVPLQGTISFEELARQVKMREHNLRRIIRYAIAWHHVFREPQPGFVAHSAASRLLVDDPAWFGAVGYMFEETAQAFTRTCDAMQKYDGEEVNQTGYTLAVSPNQSMWEYYKDNPARGKRFAGTMKAFTSNTGISLSFLVSGYPWSSLPEGTTVVDVGGSEGHASYAIAKSNPHLKLIVQDLPEVASGAREKQRLSNDPNDRIEFMGYDFLTQQSQQADVYLFRQVLHDWPDAYAIKILRNQIPALKNGAKIVVNDAVVPAPGTMPIEEERQLRFHDMIMLSLNNAREREESDWRHLFQEADPRFRNVRMWTAHGALRSFIEATWVVE